jgi:2-polyprenyl-6-methoxyphenol hydroxylase-like FAD-dependent oxidoreductase
MSQRTEVLVVGAGPTGLTLALWLARLGVRVRIVDQAAAPGTASRAIAVQARTLELHQQVGVAAEVVAQGHALVAANLWAHGQKQGRALFGAMGRELSPFPFVLMHPQDAHEQVLAAALAAAGVRVERRLTLAGVEACDAGVRAELRRVDGSVESCECAYLAGCDGAHSTVRERLGVPFPGGTYAHLFYVADVVASGPVMDGELHVALDEADFLGVFPYARGRARFIGALHAEDGDGDGDGGRAPTWDDVSPAILARLQVKVEKVAWFSTYRVHHRVAASLRRGRVFLLGDAAHIHSPVGGQGMNTGIGDAVNLAWKLAAVLKESAPAALLDSYERERIRFARRLEHTTDRAFTFVTREGRLAARVRTQIAPRVLAALFRLPAWRRLMFETVSQVKIDYRHEPLNEGRAGRVLGGDRLPWVPFGEDGAPDNFAPLASLGWQAHVYGVARPVLAAACTARHLPLHVFAWTDACARAGLAQDALYLVRPDGHVALADPTADAAVLARFLDRRGLSVGPPSGRAPRHPPRGREAGPALAFTRRHVE